MFSIFKKEQVGRISQKSFSKGKVAELLNLEYINILNQKQKEEQILINNFGKVLENYQNDERLAQIYLQLKDLASLDTRKSFSSIELETDFAAFKNALLIKFHFLSSLEVKLCSYFRFGFSSREIALLERIDLSDVRHYKNAIKKKFELKPTESLKDFLRINI